VRGRYSRARHAANLESRARGGCHNFPLICFRGPQSRADEVRIFLSYASERRGGAEPIAFALRGRGHKVFFDKNDLPPGGNYDAQIEEAVKQSDLMIFLISPESVAPERFTLTELAFARKKWGSARGRVFPVLIAPTPLSQIPAYLSSVQIMHPEGNAAAEVASFVDELTPIAKPLHILPAVLCMGAVSGWLGGLDIPYPGGDQGLDALPGFIQTLGNQVLFIGYRAHPSVWHVPYVFAMVMALVLFIWDRMSVRRSLWALPITIVAWAAAYWLAFYIVLAFTQQNILKGDDYVPMANQCKTFTDAGDPRAPVAAQSVCEEIDKYREQIKPLITRLNWLVYTVAGMAGGFVGSLLTVFGLGRLSLRLRPLDAVVLITFIGSVTGMLLNPRLFIIVQLSDQDARAWLFVVWQACVATAIAWQFTKAPRSP
jgi:hypothetical protein